MMNEINQKAWVVAVDMGYGHYRASLPFLDIAEGGAIINADDYSGIPRQDKATWQKIEKLYTVMSRLTDIPIIGNPLFNIFDKFQKIKPLIPKTIDQTPTFQLRQTYALIQKGWGQHLIQMLNHKPLPLITTFFTVAFMAEYWEYSGEIYLIVTDSDASRAWTALTPFSSHIKYLAPTQKVVTRLQTYGVKPSNIFYTGFPLPQELLGADNEIAKNNLEKRIAQLDPEKTYQNANSEIINKYIGDIPEQILLLPRPPAIAFPIGGAGAQTKIAEILLTGLLPLILKNKIILHLIAGSHQNIENYFYQIIREANLKDYFNKNIFVVASPTKEEYFKTFNSLLENIDILWTKPSELSFYAALGIPIIMTPPLGAQEVENQKWLLKLGAGINQQNPRNAVDWLPQLFKIGSLASAAMNGFINISKSGTENIKKVVFETNSSHDSALII